MSLSAVKDRNESNPSKSTKLTVQSTHKMTCQFNEQQLISIIVFLFFIQVENSMKIRSDYLFCIYHKIDYLKCQDQIIGSHKTKLYLNY